MIRLDRGSEVPKKLTDDGDAETAALIEAHATGAPIKPKKAVYGHDSVKQALERLQHGKCAFCETRLAQQFGHVEHYRPKKRWQAQRDLPARTPGYFWLAYRWENLLLSCEVCNTRYKRDYFPIRNEGNRANPNDRDITGEEPLLIDPYSIDPREHLQFQEWNIKPVEGSEIGRTSIEGFGLDSLELDEERRGRWTEVRMILDLLESDGEAGRGEARQRALDFLAEAVRDAAPYSAMIRDNFEFRIFALVNPS